MSLRIRSSRGTAASAAGKDRGAAALEFGLVVLPLLVIVWGIITYGVMLSFRQALSQAAGEGARSAVGAPTACTAMSSPYSGSTCPTQSSAASAVSNALSTYGMSCGVRNLTCVISAPTAGALPNGASCPTGHTCVQVTLTYPYRANPMVASVPGLGIVVPATLSYTATVEVS